MSHGFVVAFIYSQKMNRRRFRLGAIAYIIQGFVENLLHRSSEAIALEPFSVLDVGVDPLQVAELLRSQPRPERFDLHLLILKFLNLFVVVISHAKVLLGNGT